MKLKIILFASILVILISGCAKPDHHPKNPKYEIDKPKKKYSKASKENLSKMVKKLQGKPYVWAAEGPTQFDCSGYTYYMYGSMGIEIPRVARNQAKKGKLIKQKDLKYGDLIFFDTTKRRTGKITHVGMYLGDGWFTHASTKKYEVTYSRLGKKYYKSRIKVCRRYLPPTLKSNEPIWNVSPNIRLSSSKKSNKKEPMTLISKNIKKEKVSRSRKHKLISMNGSYIQVGSYVNKPESSVIRKIELLGLPYEIIKFPKNGKFVNKLLIGPYNSANEAKSILSEVKRNINSGSFLVKID